ncbi:hypothetical protein [Sphingopyxis sp. SCN 67-31]|nr:hypothetical protein [Sphingopyxis sp. SCN 67-31]
MDSANNLENGGFLPGMAALALIWFCCAHAAGRSALFVGERST